MSEIFVVALGVVVFTLVILALVMIICNVIAIAIGKATIKQPNVGLQLPSAAMFGGLSHGAMLGTLSLGHILGMGAILGLAARGVL